MSNIVLITGGCGFVGTNLAARLLKQGFVVRILDNLSRPGTEINRTWLKQLEYGSSLTFTHCNDVRDAEGVKEAVADVDCIFHLAAQVAVTTSLAHPRLDLYTNVIGTFNVLEAARHAPKPPLVVFTSTNKVYGATNEIPIVELLTRYGYADQRPGISELQALDFHSPYGCSKGSADQYVHDYGRIYGIPTVVLRMSCIYGPHQYGNEDQGWIAHFLISALNQRLITIYGDGKQVRDILHIDDLLDLFELVMNNRRIAAGQIFNVGGGETNALSIWAEFGALINRLLQRTVDVQYGPWRPGDQKVYISDISHVSQLLGWKPQIGVQSGITRTLRWLEAEKSIVDLHTNMMAVG